MLDAIVKRYSSRRLGAYIGGLFATDTIKKTYLQLAGVRDVLLAGGLRIQLGGSIGA